MHAAVEKVLRHFEHNRASAEQTLRQHLEHLEGHEHGLFCVRWRWCRQSERAVQAAENHIEAYREAEEALRRGDYQSAIEVLEQLASWLYETPMQRARRVMRESPYTAESILSSPGVLYARVVELRDSLVSLLPKNATA